MQCSNMYITFNAMPSCCSCQRFLVYLYVFLEKYEYINTVMHVSRLVVIMLCWRPALNGFIYFVPQIRSCRLFCWLFYGENLKSTENKQHYLLDIFLYIFFPKKNVKIITEEYRKSSFYLLQIILIFNYSNYSKTHHPRNSRHIEKSNKENLPLVIMCVRINVFLKYLRIPTQIVYCNLDNQNKLAYSFQRSSLFVSIIS
jgi:hypothetical protein